MAVLKESSVVGYRMLIVLTLLSRHYRAADARFFTSFDMLHVVAEKDGTMQGALQLLNKFLILAAVCSDSALVQWTR